MTPEQFTIFLEKNEKSTAEAIERTVNGKIRTLTELVRDHNTKHEADMADIKPIIEAYNGGKALGNLLKWIGSVIGAGALIWALFK